MRIAHITIKFRFGDESSYRVNDNYIYRTTTNENFYNFQSLFTGIGLREKQVIQIDTKVAGIFRVQSMLCINECRDASSLLCFRNDMER